MPVAQHRLFNKNAGTDSKLENAFHAIESRRTILFLFKANPVPHLLSLLNNRYLRNCILAAFLLLPWLSPYTAGSTPNVWSWLLSALCAVFLWLFRRRLNPELVAVAWVLAAAVSAAIGLVQYFVRIAAIVTADSGRS